jgi:hypothetical protein
MTGAPSAVLARLRSRGHPAIRATHDASWELVVEPEVTERGTCIVGVGTELVEGTVDGLVGPITIELTVDGHSIVVDAVANPDHRGIAEGVVVRRSRARLPDTLATEATIGAAELDRAWVARLARADALLDVVVRSRVRRTDGRPQLVVGRVDATTAGRTDAEVEVADAVVVEHAMLRRHERRAEVAPDVLADGGRVLVLGRGELVGRSVPSVLGDLAGLDDAVELEWFGLSPGLGLAAALGGDGPLLLCGRLAGADDRRRLAKAVADGVRVVAAVDRDGVGLALAALPADAVAAVLVDADRPGRRVVRRPGSAVRYGDENLLAVGRAAALAGEPRPDTVEPPGLVASLLAAGVAPTTITRALAGQPGWTRNRAYDLVLRARERDDAGDAD